jgi:3-oxoacyl-[acyl-carrier protein] reductase
MSEAGLQDRRALVTGASRGIGRATALALAAAGAQVAINYARSEAEARATAERITAAGGEALLVPADVGEPAAIAALFEQLKCEWGGVDILVNNAAVTHDGYLMMLSEHGWDDVLRTNLRGAFLCARHALRAMIAGRWGRIINVISPAGVLGQEGAANYAASKGGLLSMGKSLAREVARYNITVNAVCPGLIETQLIAGMPAAERARFLGQIPLNRFGTPEEVADAIVFLSSERARYITGSTLTVDGGLTMI